MKTRLKNLLVPALTAVLVLPAFFARAGAVLTTLHSFQVFTNGANPHAGPVQGGYGSFYGTTEIGGTHANGSPLSLIPAGQDSAHIASATMSKAIPWSQIVQKACTPHQGEDLGTNPTPEGARLPCVFQRLEGQATREGLWLTSTVPKSVNDRFRIIAVEVGREVNGGDCGTSHHPTREPFLHAPPLSPRGAVFIDGQSVCFIRPGLVEEYTASMDGVRQDFVVRERPLSNGRPGAGVAELALLLAVSGAKVEPASFGVQLVLENSGRKIAYSRLRVTDATGRELSARMEAGGARGSLLTVLVNDAEAVYPVRIDPTFSDANWTTMNPSIPGASSDVYAAIVDGSGNLYIGGNFTLAGKTLGNYIAKWDGSSWSALGSGLGTNPAATSVNALAVSGSNVYAAGNFNTAGGVAANNIAKWNGSGWSALGLGLNGQIAALAVSGSNVFAAGYFNTAGGVAANNIAKWDGSSWSALASGMNGGVNALAVLGSDVYAGGFFTTAGGNVANNVAKWNGSSWSVLASGMNGGVNALAVSGSTLYVAGSFTNAGGNAVNYIAQWNGSSWSALGSGMGGGVNDSYVKALAVSGNNVYAAGDFTTAGGNPASYTAKWDGSSWSALGSGMSGNYLSVRVLAASGSNIYVGGTFTTAGGSVADNIAKWDGSSWSALGSGMNMNSYVNTLAVSGGDLYAAGYFTTAGGSPASYTAKWDGSSWSALDSGVNNIVDALAVSGTNVYAAGDFTVAGGSPANYIATWDGSNWSALGSGMNNIVDVLAVSGANLYAGGYFTTAGGSAANYIAKWDGSSWSAPGSGMGAPFASAYVVALAVSGTNLYVGGYFTTAGGSAANNVAKWDGSRWSPLGSGMGGQINALAVSGTDVYAGGFFTTAGGRAANCIAKWNGSSWSALGSGMGGYPYPGVYALAVSASDLYAGGDFTTAGGSAANYIARWDGSSWSSLGSGMDGHINALAVLGSDLFAGGAFTATGGTVSAYIARGYLSSLPALSALRSGNNVVVSWPSDAAGFALEQTGTVAPPAAWAQYGGIITDDGTNKSVTYPAVNSAQFFHLRRP